MSIDKNELYRLWNKGLTQKQLAKYFSVSIRSIEDNLLNHRKHLTNEYNEFNNSFENLAHDIKKEIRAKQEY